jgi:hypothetical protein
MKLKIFTLFFAASVICATGLTQPSIIAQKTMGGNYGDDFSSMWLTNDGGLIIGGSSASDISGEKTSRKLGFDDFWLIKLNKMGKIQLDKTFGGSNDDRVTSLQQTSDGGYIIGGYSDSYISGDKTEDNRGLGSDYWVIKLDAKGNKLWDKTIGGDRDDYLASIRQTPDGGYVIGGWSVSNISGEKAENSRGGGDFWIVKLDGNGNKLWDKTLGGSGEDELTSLELTNDGGYIAGGWSRSNASGEKTENGRGNWDYWVVKLNSSGYKLWDKTFGGNDDDELNSIQQTSDGGYILGGTSNSNISGEKTESSRGSSDYWVVKLDSGGNRIRDKTIGGNGLDWLNSVQQTTDGGYMLGGYSDSKISGEKTEDTRGSNDYWIVRLNASGNLLWDKTIGGDKIDKCLSIKEVSGNNYVLGGSSYSGISGDKTEPSRGNDRSDYWLVLLNYKKKTTLLLNPLIGIQNQALKNNKVFIVHPNPAKDILHIQNAGKATVTLTDQQGKTILTKTINGNEAINVSHLPAALYYLKNNATGVVQKIMIAK